MRTDVNTYLEDGPCFPQIHFKGNVWLGERMEEKKMELSYFLSEPTKDWSLQIGEKIQERMWGFSWTKLPLVLPSKFQYFSLSLSSLPFLFVFVLLCFICFFYSLFVFFFDRTVLVLVYIRVCRVLDQGLCSFLGGIYIQFLFIYKKVLHFN